MIRFQVDIAVVGGGIAGLWAQNVLRQHGYQSILLEKSFLGDAQTLASQGMIHGGQRYNLQGKKSDHSNSISAMPAIWDACLKGESALDLSSTQILAPNQYMWSPGGMASGVAAFFASKSMNAKVAALSNEELPEIFKSAPKFKGSVYRMDESVLEIKSLLKALSTPIQETLYKLEVTGIHKKPDSISIKGTVGGEDLEIEAKACVFTAGLGNEIAIRDNPCADSKPKSQRRPLKQIMIKGIKETLYAHCITTDPRPRMTVTAHPMGDGFYVWYLGGIVAEFGIDKSDDIALANAKKEMSSVFPWIDWTSTEWSTILVDRAEPFFDKSFFKSGPELLDEGTLALSWPTKLTFAPAAANQILDWIRKRDDITPNPKPIDFDLPHPEIGPYPWETAKWSPY